jgi:hypothetical protein
MEWHFAKNTSAREASVEQSEDYIIGGFFLLTFLWISVQDFLDICREEICMMSKSICLFSFQALFWSCLRYCSVYGYSKMLANQKRESCCVIFGSGFRVERWKDFHCQVSILISGDDG